MLGMDDAELETTIRAARLAKADLATQMVIEMTSLQGVMGREYALRSGEPEAVAEAIAEHYLPRFAGDTLPTSLPGIAIALADRLDSLVGLFSAGLEPTGSADPFGLRRAALGVVQILIGHGIRLDLRQAVEWAAMGYTQALGENHVSTEAKAAAMNFIAGRLRVVLRETYAHDVVEAVLGQVAHDPCRAAMHAQQLSAWVQRPDWEPTLDAYARCLRITRSQETIYTLHPDRLAEPAEKALVAAYRKAAKALGPDRDVDGFLTAFLPLVGPITTFFAPASEGGVLVMHEDRATRENRLALLQHIVALADGVADLSQMEGF
jgi:glycyl-tRNA synthetase